MKTAEQIEKETTLIMQVVEQYINEGRTYAIFRWLKEHHLLGHVQKESKRELMTINRDFIRSNVANLIDYHIM